jgi:hypothetical protein
VDAEFASDVLHKLMGTPKPVEVGAEWNTPAQVPSEGLGGRGSLRVIPWEQWSKERSEAVASASAQQQELRPSKRSRIESKGTGADQAAGAAAGVKLMASLQDESGNGEAVTPERSGRCIVM